MIQYLCGRNISSLVIMVQKTNFCLHLCLVLNMSSLSFRMFIWRSLIRLPENHAAYGALVDKGTHPSYEKLHETYPIKCQKLLCVLQRRKILWQFYCHKTVKEEWKYDTADDNK
ncbi:hypothetical protein LSH36_2277g00003 [Paralvinella palmiformis]|uniref:Uncharacterized protein n=1 Tax=Paralvinella palmiformis TaxID=53620 RepID=A0AAD9IQN3_9ANNE|nr:hypothetical protein LSH36_2277g00003 [Paralvinella palmiformis]